MFGSLGMPELILILVIALIVFGPKKLPEVGRSLGKAMREFKRTTEEIKGKFEEQINAEEFKDIKNDLNDIKAEIKSATELPPEIKELTRDINAPREVPAPADPGANASGAPPHTEPGMAESEVGAAGAGKASETESTKKPDSAPHPDSEDTSQHGEG
jgi:sec-independent protein translocase protein TatA